MKNFTFKKTLFRIFLFFLSMNATNLFSQAPQTFTDYFGDAEYTVTVFDLTDYIDTYIQKKHHAEMKEDDALVAALSFLGLETKKNYSLKHFFKIKKDATQLLKKEPSGKIHFRKTPCKRVRDTMEFMEGVTTGKNITPYEMHLETQGGEQKNLVKKTLTHEEIHLVPTLIKKGQTQPTHRRHNLFDMLSPKLDQYIEQFGIWQEISHESKKLEHEIHQEISLLVSVSCKCGFNVLGVMQYTFNDENACYHRAFKPLTQSHIKRLSNSNTQWIMQFAIYDLLRDAETEPKTLSAKALQPFLKTINDDEYKLIRESMVTIERIYKNFYK